MYRIIIILFLSLCLSFPCFSYESKQNLDMLAVGQDVQTLGFMMELRDQYVVKEESKIQFGKTCFLYPLKGRLGEKKEVFEGIAVIDPGLDKPLYQVCKTTEELIEVIEKYYPNFRKTFYPDIKDSRAYIFYVLMKYNESFFSLIPDLARKNILFWWDFDKKTEQGINLGVWLKNMIDEKLKQVVNYPERIDAGDTKKLITQLKILEEVDQSLFWEMAERFLLTVSYLKERKNEELTKFLIEIKNVIYNLYMSSMFFNIFENVNIGDKENLRFKFKLKDKYEELDKMMEVNEKSNIRAIDISYDITDFEKAVQLYNKVVVLKGDLRLKKEEEKIIEKVKHPFLDMVFKQPRKMDIFAKKGVNGKLSLLPWPESKEVEEVWLQDEIYAGDYEDIKLIKTIDVENLFKDLDGYIDYEKNILKKITDFEIRIIENMQEPIQIEYEDEIIKIDSRIARKDFNEIILLMIIYSGLETASFRSKKQINPVREYVDLLVKGLELYRKQVNDKDIKELIKQIKQLQGMDFYKPLKITKAAGKIDFAVLLESFPEVSPKMFKNIAFMYASLDWRA